MSLTSVKKIKRINYTAEEKRELASLVNKFKHILENKKTNAVNNKVKDVAWEKICNLFNQKTVVRRDSTSLRKQWSNMKQDVRKTAAAQKREMYATGGGPKKEIEPDSLILSIVNNKTVSGLNNSFDSDFIFEVTGSDEENIADERITSEENVAEEIIVVGEDIEKDMEMTIENPPRKHPEPSYSCGTEEINTPKNRKVNFKRNNVDEAKISVLKKQEFLLNMEIEHKNFIYKIQEENEESKKKLLDYEIRIKQLELKKLEQGFLNNK